MNIEALAEFVDDMIVQNDYPGFEPRSLKIGLPESINKCSHRIFGQALGHDSVYVRLAALRWFQEKPGLLKPYVRVLNELLTSDDSWIRMESIRCLERMNSPSSESLVAISRLLTDENLDVSKAAAKACGKMGRKLKLKDGEVVEALKKVALEGDAQLKWKAEKALRQIGVYG